MGVQNKQPSVGGVWIFSGIAQFANNLEMQTVVKWHCLGEACSSQSWIFTCTLFYKMTSTVKINVQYSIKFGQNK